MTDSERHSPFAYVLATAILLCSVCALHPQFITHLSTHFIGGALGDGGLYVWLAASFHADPLAALTFDTNGFHPYPTTRAWSDLFFLPSLIIHLLMSCGASLETAYNLTCITAMVLNGIGILALSRTLGCSRFAATCAAVAFANCSYLIGNLGHPQLMYIFWIPLCWSLSLSATTGALRWLLLGLCISGAFYSSVYYAVFAATGTAIILALQILTRLTTIREALRAGFLIACGTLPVVYAIPAYLAVKETFGSRGLHEAEAFAASGLSYLAFSSFHPLFGSTSAWTHGEATLCVGYTLLALALLAGLSLLKSHRALAPILTVLSAVIVGISSSIVDPSTLSEWVTTLGAWAIFLAALFIPIRSPSTHAILFAVVAVFFSLSFGPGGNLHKHEPAFAPLTLFYSIIPGFDAIRATSRCGAVVVLGLFVVLALILTAFERSRASSRWIVGILLTSLIVFENYIPQPPLDPATKPPLAVDGLRERIAPHEAVLFLPFSNTAERGRIQSWTDFAILNTQYTQWTAPLRIKTINGYSGQRSKIINELPQLLASFPAGDWSSYLARICGASWIIVTPEWGARLTQGTLPDGVSIVERYSDSSALLQVTTPISLTPSQPQLLFAPRTPTLTFIRSSPDCSVEVSAQIKQNRSVRSEAVTDIRTSNNGSHMHVGERLDSSLQPLTLLLNAPRCSATIRCVP